MKEKGKEEGKKKKASFYEVMVLGGKKAHISHKHSFISSAAVATASSFHPSLVVSSSLDLMLDMPIHQGPVSLLYER